MFRAHKKAQTNLRFVKLFVAHASSAKEGVKLAELIYYGAGAPTIIKNFVETALFVDIKTFQTS